MFNPFGATITRFHETGEVSEDSMGLIRMVSPVSGAIITTVDPHAVVRDPISGAHLRIQGGRVEVVNPAEYQQLHRSSKFFVHREPDVSMQTLRKTRHVSSGTNEKVGTAGTPTGIDPGLMIVKAVSTPASRAASGRPSRGSARPSQRAPSGRPPMAQPRPAETSGHETRQFAASGVSLRHMQGEDATQGAAEVHEQGYGHDHGHSHGAAPAPPPAWATAESAGAPVSMGDEVLLAAAEEPEPSHRGAVHASGDDLDAAEDEGVAGEMGAGVGEEIGGEGEGEEGGEVEVGGEGDVGEEGGEAGEGDEGGEGGEGDVGEEGEEGGDATGAVAEDEAS